MLQSLKNLSKGKKIGIGAGAGVLAILLAVLAVWQPWKQGEVPPDDTQQGTTDQIQQPGEPAEEEKPVTLRVGNKEIPCVIHEGDGWSVYVPEEWTAESDGETAARFTSPEGASVYVSRVKELPEGTLPAGTYASIYPTGEELNREFYTGDGRSSWTITCTAPREKWEDFDALFRAIGRTGVLEDGKPFDAWTPMPDEPEWQTIEEDMILFLDKDGAPLSGDAEQAVRARMMAWPDEDKTAFTGRYRFGLEWCASYVKLGDHLFTDVFSSGVSYEIKTGEESRVTPVGGQEVRDGWLYEDGTLYVAAAHDGSQIEKKTVLWSSGAVPGTGEFALDIAEALK